jgi:hypothetical protein
MPAMKCRGRARADRDGSVQGGCALIVGTEIRPTRCGPMGLPQAHETKLSLSISGATAHTDRRGDVGCVQETAGKTVLHFAIDDGRIDPTAQ